jgi:hypothetical protein
MRLSSREATAGAIARLPRGRLDLPRAIRELHGRTALEGEPRERYWAVNKNS